MKITEQQSRQIEYLLIFFIAFLFLAFWQFNLSLGDPDGFYHTKIALFLSQGTLLRSLPWMQFTTLKEHFTDHHLLYHLLLVPLVKLGNPLYAVKLATCLLGAGFFTVFSWFTRRFAGRWSMLVTILLLISPAFAFRAALIKANTASLIVLFIILAGVIQGKTWRVFWSQAIYVWLYGGWILGPAVAGLYWLTVMVARLFKKGQLSDRWWQEAASRTVLAAILGAAVGLVLNPYWPYNLFFYWQQIVDIGVINYSGRLNVGAEWLSLDWRQLINFHLYPLILIALAILFGWKRWRQLLLTDWFLIILAVISLLLTYKSRRYVELSEPLLLVAAAILGNRLLAPINWVWIKARLEIKGKAGRLIRYYFIICLLIFSPLLIFLIMRDVVGVRQNQAQSGYAVNYFSAEASWLMEHSQAGDIVFNADWDYWPPLFYYDTKNYYLVGLDPTFMYKQNPMAYDLWTAVTTNKSSGDISQIIGRFFHSRYVLVANGRSEFIKQLDANPAFALRFQGSYGKIYELTNYDGKNL